jgi:hypothetical protein
LVFVSDILSQIWKVKNEGKGGWSRGGWGERGRDGREVGYRGTA